MNRSFESSRNDESVEPFHKFAPNDYFENGFERVPQISLLKGIVV